MNATVKTAKVENYTTEMTEELKKAFDGVTTHEAAKAVVEMLAAKWNKAVKSIIAKASREGVYIKAAYVNKKGVQPVAKETLADGIGRILGLSEPDVSSLTKSNKRALQTIFDALANSRPIDGNE